MSNITSREEILKKVRNAAMQQAANPYSKVALDKSIYPKMSDDLEVIFAEELNHIGGHFVYCETIDELKENLFRFISAQNTDKLITFDPAIIKLLESINIYIEPKVDNYSEIEASITRCEALVARLGSVMVSSKQITGRILNFIPDTHIVIASREEIVATVKEAIILIDKKYEGDFPSMTTLITGPSRTADIEKTLVMGAHGPRSLIVFLMESDFLK